MLTRRALLTASLAVAGTGGLAACGAATGSGTPSATPSGQVLDEWYLSTQYGIGASPTRAVEMSTQVATPHFAAKQTAAAMFGQVDQWFSVAYGMPAAGNYRAAPGYEILIVDLLSGDPAFAPDANTVGFELQRGDHKEVIGAPFGSYTAGALFGGGYEHSGVRWAMSVPLGKPALLRIIDEEPLELDLRTGTVQSSDTAKACAVLTKAAKGTFGQDKYTQHIEYTTTPPAGYQTEDGALDLDFSLEDARLSPWIPQQRWAEAGKTWLILSAKAQGGSGTAGSGVGMTLKPSEWLHVKTNGEPASIANDAAVELAGIWFQPSATHYYFAVPADARQFEVTIDNKAPVTKTYRNTGEVRTVDRSRTDPFTTTLAVGPA